MDRELTSINPLTSNPRRREPFYALPLANKAELVPAGRWMIEGSRAPNPGTFSDRTTFKEVPDKDAWSVVLPVKPFPYTVVRSITLRRTDCLEVHCHWVHGIDHNHELMTVGVILNANGSTRLLAMATGSLRRSFSFSFGLTHPCQLGVEPSLLCSFEWLFYWHLTTMWWVGPLLFVLYDNIN